MLPVTLHVSTLSSIFMVRTRSLLLRCVPLSSESPLLLSLSKRLTQVDCWIDWANSDLNTTDDDKLFACLDELNAHLRLRTALVGHDIGLADAVVWATLARSSSLVFYLSFLFFMETHGYICSFSCLGWHYQHEQEGEVQIPYSLVALSGVS